MRGVGFALPALAALLLLCAATPVRAAVPAHPRAPSLDVVGLNHACGVAVDTKGDLYAASAGAGKILIFSPADHETPIGEIANANEPCALALTSAGVLYVSEAKTGQVVRYKPTAYPFLGAPSYGPREVIDSSGQAKGIAVDPSDDRLYVAEGNHVSVYDSQGNLGVNEVQEVRCFQCTGGEYKLIFKGEETKGIPAEAQATVLQAALEELASIDPGDVSVENGSNLRVHLVTFKGKYAHTDVEALGCNKFTIEGSGTQECKIAGEVESFGGHIGEGDLSEATGVAPFTYKTSASQITYSLAVADAASDQVKLFSAQSFTQQKLRRTLDGPAAGEEFGFGAAGAYLGADRGTCPPTTKACTAGHFFLYDDAHAVLDEFEASGALVSQTPFAFGDGVPTAIAVDRSGGEGNGTLYATSGAGTAARVLAFGALSAPSRPGPLAERSLAQEKSCSVAIDDYGNRYVAVGTEVFVYPPSGGTGTKPLVKIALGEKTCRIAVDGEGNLYALFSEKVAHLKPSAFPPKEGTTYEAPVTVAKQSEFSGISALSALAVNPANGHLFVTNGSQVFEYKAAKEGSEALNKAIGVGLGISNMFSLGVCGANGNIYIGTSGGTGQVVVLDSSGKEVLIRITGQGSPAGSLGPSAGAIAVDQSNCHVIAFEPGRKDLEEYEASGTFVAAFGSFESLITGNFGVAVDNGANSPNKGGVYLAYDDPVGEYDLTAFGGLGYGSRLTVIKKGLGTVTSEPPGIDCGSECGAEYKEGEEVTLTAVASKAYEGAEFIGWGAGDCDSETVSLTEGTCTLTLDEAEVTVTASFRAPPLAIAQAPQPLGYTEADLRGKVDPAGSPTTYSFQYLTQAQYEANGGTFAGALSTPVAKLPASEGFLAVKAHLHGLAEATSYRFRLLAENEAGEAEDEGTFTTLAEAEVQPCPNAALRTGASASLPDCRAYELVSPPEDAGYTVGWNSSDPANGNFATALAGADGESVVFETYGGPLPEVGGNGVSNGYRARRGASGWSTASYGPTYAQMSSSGPGGVSADQAYSFWATTGESGTLDPKEGNNARYLALPEAVADPACGPEAPGRFELIGCGPEGEDPEAIGRWISPNGGHVIFTSDQSLAPGAPAKGTAVYDRSAGTTAQVISLLPEDVTPSGSATYEGVSADGSAVAFGIGGAHYVRRGGETLEVSAGPATFAGLSREGRYAFYIDKAVSLEVNAAIPDAGLFVCDLEAGPCAGPGAQEATEIAAEAIFVNVAADGTRAYLTSSDALAPGAEAGKDNLYLWEAEGDVIQFVAVLAEDDVEGPRSLARWVSGFDPKANGTDTGPAIDPSRTTPDGSVLVFQSIAPLTGYDSKGNTEVFRYGAEDESLLCISCGPEGSVAHSDAQLQDEAPGFSPLGSALTLTANLSTDGSTAFFTSGEPLVPADHNGVADVYEWREGQLALISSGQSAYPSYLYAVSASGDDVFFATREALVAGDDEDGGSQSIYDARVNGGFAAPGGGGACEGGEACRGVGPPPPSLSSPPTTSLPSEPLPNQTRTCPKGKHKVKRAGKVHCVKPKPKKPKHHSKRRKGGSGR